LSDVRFRAFRSPRSNTMKSMKILSAAEMRACDQLTSELFGVPSTKLMFNAAQAVLQFIEKHHANAHKILILAGLGNNGGDGLVVARLMLQRNRDVKVILLGEPEGLKGDAAIAWRWLREEITEERSWISPLGPPPKNPTTPDVIGPFPRRSLTPPSLGLHLVTGAEGLNSHTQHLERADLILDAVLGTGFKPPLRELAEATRRWLLAQPKRAPVLAVDLPSGWDADSTEATSVNAFPADAVITFTAPKPAHVFGQLTRSIRQPIVVAPIGSPDEATLSDLNLHWSGSAKKITEAERPANSNKGMYGHVLVIGGSPGKSGAPAMASLAAMRTGAGLVTAAVTPSVLPLVAGIAPELMTRALAVNADGEISTDNLNEAALASLLEGIKVLAIGPGLGMSPEATEFAIGLLSKSKLPAVADADALNAIATRPDLLRELAAGRTLVLTPHPGEMGRLVNKTTKEVEADRINIARDFATKNQVILVLKGWRTLIAHPDGSIAINTTGNPAMAKGGSGDLLTGMVAALLGQHPDEPGRAVEAAVYLHGLAADLTVAGLGVGGDQHTLLATDSLANLHSAFRYDARDAHGFTWLQGTRTTPLTIRNMIHQPQPFTFQESP
jgi:hydroxyethylthiazole kinase-like uncharacterized protein yjeF